MLRKKEANGAGVGGYMRRRKRRDQKNTWEPDTAGIVLGKDLGFYSECKGEPLDNSEQWDNICYLTGDRR